MKQTITLGLAAAMVSWLVQPGYAEARGGEGFGGGGHFGGGGGAHFSGGGAHFSAPAMRSAPSFHSSSSSHFSTAQAPHYSNYSNINNYRTYGSTRSSTTFAPSIASQNRAFVRPQRSAPSVAFGGSSVSSRGRGNVRTFAAPAGVSRGWDRGHIHTWNHRHYRYYNGNWFGIDGGFYGPYGYGYADYPDAYDYGYDQPYYDSGDNYAGPAPALAMSQGLVAAVQNQLTRLGYVAGAADGVIGPLTQNALANFQRDHNLSVTGQLDQITIQALGVPYD